MQDFSKSREVLLLAKSARERTGTLVSSEGAQLLLNIGTTLRCCEDRAGQQRAYYEAKHVHEATDTLRTREGAVLLKHLGLLLSKQGVQRSQEALETIELAVTIFKELDIMESQDGANLLRDVGKVTMACTDDLEKASECFEHAWLIRTNLGGKSLNCPDAANLIRDIGYVKECRGDLEGAKSALSCACHTLESLGLGESKTGNEFSIQLAAIEAKIAAKSTGFVLTRSVSSPKSH